MFDYERVIGEQSAYPWREGSQDLHAGGTGLTKRELFAAMAMQGLLSGERSGVTEISAIAVKYADSLLTELEKTK